MFPIDHQPPTTDHAFAFYATGGTMPYDAPSYVERAADGELYEHLSRGEFCYVLDSRQMGKSSLMVRTAARLRADGAAVARLDLNASGQNLTPEQWYSDLLYHLGLQLGLEERLEAFEQRFSRFSPLQRWTHALRAVVLEGCPGRVVIFIDEIEYVLKLPFPIDEFFAAIRECYNRRSDRPELNRLTFCLLGVASPSDLIRDTRMTPFNIGRRIQLHDFTLQEAAPLAHGLRRPRALALALLERVFYWTGGHPYLTQRLCQEVAQDERDAGRAGVDRLCQNLYFARSPRDEDHLQLVPQRLLQSGGGLPPEDEVRAGLLHLYDRVLRTPTRGTWRSWLWHRSGEPVREDHADALVETLRLSGMVRVVDGVLRVRNRIYERVFDRQWVRAQMPDAEVRRQRGAYRRGLLRATAVAGAIIAVMGLLVHREQAASHRLRLANTQMRLARGRAEREERVARTALAERTRALQEREQALRQVAEERDHARRAAARAERAERLERVARQRAVGEGRRAEQQGRIAERRRAEAERERLRARRAERAATKRLWDSYLAQARALRWSRRAGQRFESLDVLRKAAAIRPSLELRNEAIACMALADLRVAREWDDPPRDTRISAVDDRLEQYAREDRAIGAISIRRVADGRERARLPIPGRRLLASRFSPDGRFFSFKTAVHPGTDVRLSVWDLARREPVLDVRGDVAHYAQIFTPDSRLLVTGWADGSLAVHDVVAGREIRRFRLGTLPHSFRFHPDGRQLAASIPDSGEVQILRDIETGRLMERFSHPSAVYEVAWSPDGRLLAAACADYRVYGWDVPARRKHAVLTGHTAEVTMVEFNHTGDLLASGGWDGTTRLWEPRTGRQRLRAERGFGQFSPDDRWLGPIDWSGKSALREVAAGRECRVFQGHVGPVKGPYGAAIHPDGRLMISGSGDGVRFWDLAAGREIAFLDIGPARAVFHPDGKSLFTSGDSGLRRWPLTAHPSVSAGIGAARNLGLTGIMGELSLSRDGRRLAVVDKSSRHAILLDPENPARRVVLTDHESLDTIALSPNGRWVATGTWRGTGVRVWDARTGRLLRELPVPGGATVAFSPDARWLATDCRDGARLWHAGSWRPARPLLVDSRRNQRFGPLHFSRDGTLLAINETPLRTTLVDVTTGRELASFPAPDEIPSAPMGFSPDGGQLVVSSADWLIHVWDLARIRRQLREMGLDWRGSSRSSIARHPGRQRVR